MPVIHLDIDEATAKRLEERARASGTTLEAVAASLLHESVPSRHPIVGLFRDEPGLLDEIVAEAHDLRRTLPARVADVP